MWGIDRSPVWGGALIFSLIFAWTNNWVNNRDAGDLKHHRTHNDATVLRWKSVQFPHRMSVKREACACHDVIVDYLTTGNHYKRDWPKSQFCMLDILASIDWLRNLKVANIYLFNILQNTLKIFSFSKLEIRKLENLILPSSAEPCRILQNSALVPQNSAEHLGKNHVILRNSAEWFLFHRTVLRNYKTL